jgi:gluconate transporter
MPLLIVAIGVAILLVLMIGFKINGFISLIIVSLFVAVAEGMPLDKVVKSVEGGMGGTLGHMALVVGFGAMIGNLIAESGAAQRIATTLIDKFGKKNVQWAMLLTGFVVGIAMFYEVGFVLLIPIVFTVCAAAELPLLYVGVPMAAALSVTHALLPPHPGPTAIAVIYGANISTVLFYGLIIAIPTVIVAGPVFSKALKRFEKEPPKGLFNPKIFKDEEMPSFATCIFTALVPLILMGLSAVGQMTLQKDVFIRTLIEFIGDPVMAMLLSVIISLYTLGYARGKKTEELMKIVSTSISSVAMIILIIGGGGALKQVLIDSGVGKYIATIMAGSQISPLILAWLIAAILRLALGSATVAAMTTAGIVLPLIGATGVNPALMVLATGAGSVVFSHVNDPGFWIFKEYFNLTIGETIASWSMLETIISVMGLAGVLVINMFV